MSTQTYEFVVLLSPDLSEQELTRKQDAILDLIKKYSGQVGTVEVWGRKPLAYDIKSFSEAVYVFYTFGMPKDQVAGFDQEVRLMEGVIRYLLTKEEKKNDKSEDTKGSKQETPLRRAAGIASGDARQGSVGQAESK